MGPLVINLFAIACTVGSDLCMWPWIAFTDNHLSSCGWRSSRSRRTRRATVGKFYSSSPA